MGWLQANCTKQQVNPLVRGELTAATTVFFEIEGCQLDRLEVLDPERASLPLRLVIILMTNLDLRPDPANQQPIEFSDKAIWDMDIFVSETHSLGPIFVVLGQVAHFDLVDEGVSPFFFDPCLRLIGLLRPHKALRQSVVYHTQPSVDGRL